MKDVTRTRYNGKCYTHSEIREVDQLFDNNFRWTRLLLAPAHQLLSVPSQATVLQQNYLSNCQLQRQRKK